MRKIRTCMQKLKKLYNNSIVQFLISYVLILVIPLIISLFGFRCAFSVVEKDIHKSNVTMLNHSKNLIDVEMHAIQTLALQISQNDSICELGEKTILDSEYFLFANQVIKEFYILMRYQGINLISDAYIFLHETDFVIYDSSLYRAELFDKYVNTASNMTLEERREICSKNDSWAPTFVATERNLDYVMPFGTIFPNQNLGVIVFNVNVNEVAQLFSFSKEYDEYSVFILNNNNEILWSDDAMKYRDQLDYNYNEVEAYINIGDKHIIYTTSQKLGWKYILVIPEKMALSQLNDLKIIIFILIMVATAIGILVSTLMSVKNGKPINEIINIFKGDNESSKDFKNLGEIVARIIKNNQELMVEIEEEKPLLEKAFFYELIKGGFVNNSELFFQAQKAGIEFTGKSYRVVSFKLFMNNDFYDIDAQTVEEVRIIFQLIMNYIIKESKVPVWFYKKNYLTTLAIFNENEESEVIKNLIERTYKWALNEYTVDSSWGISRPCHNLLEIWRASEEAEVANAHYSGQHVVEYCKDLEKPNTIYYPELLEERLINSIKSADIEEVDFLLSVLEKENFKNRQMNRKLLIKLNSRITAMLSHPLIISSTVDEWILELNELVINYAGYYEEYFSKLQVICHSLCQEMSQKKSINRGKLIEKITVFINDNYSDSGLGLASVASEFNISEGYVSSIFKAQSAGRFADYVEKIRIDKACHLLIEAEVSINDIAETVGYNSVQSFRRAFKRVKGVSPKEYR